MALGTFHGLTAKGTTRQQENKKKPKNGKVGEKERVVVFRKQNQKQQHSSPTKWGGNAKNNKEKNRGRRGRRSVRKNVRRECHFRRFEPNERAPNSQNPKKPHKYMYRCVFLMGVTDTETGMLPDDFQKRNMRSKI